MFIVLESLYCVNKLLAAHHISSQSLANHCDTTMPGKDNSFIEQY